MEKKNHSTEKEFSLVVSQKEAIIGGILIGCSFLFVFAGGYFLGKKNALEELALQYDDECFADKVSQSLSAFYDQGEGLEVNEAGDEEIEEKGGLVNSEDSLNVTSETTAVSVEPELEVKAFAHLCGFHSAELAHKYGSRLLKRGIPYQIFERKSKSKKNKVIVWYQVATEVMDKKTLLDLIEKISKEDRLVDVCVIDVESM